jgi:hypothetical protein
MFLGPRKLLRDHEEQHASILRTQPDLLPIRQVLANILRTEYGVDVVIMEDEQPRSEDQTYTAKFLRLVRERRVESFFLLWPCRAQLNGMDVELGHILGGLERGSLQPDDVALLVEEGVIRTDEDGKILGHAETGNRTWYYEDLLAYGCPFYTWRTMRGLYANVAAAALDLEKHRITPTPEEPWRWRL